MQEALFRRTDQEDNVAILTTDQLAAIRRRVAKAFNPDSVRWKKPEINAALQAIEDWFEANKASGSAAVDTATAPFVFTGAEKKLLFAYWLLVKHNIEMT
jgi:hypothetical protein